MSQKSKLLCKYGNECYRKNKYHLSTYYHKEIEDNVELKMERTAKKIKMNKREISKKEYSEEVKMPSNKIEKLSIPENNISNHENQKEANKCNKEDEKFVENIMQMPMPKHFFEFWDFCVSIDKYNPMGALNIINIELIGAFRLLMPTFDRSRNLVMLKKTFLMQDRYFYDPPQFSPLFRYNDPTNEEFKLHFGYYRDYPTELPVFLTSNDPYINGKHTECGHDIFSSIRSHINKTFPLKNSLISKLLTKMPPTSLKDSSFLKKRNKDIVCVPLNGIGLVVKIEPKTKTGYRELPESNDKIRKIILAIEKSASLSDTCKLDESFDPLMELVTLTQFANDELDYGMGLELGLDLFYGSRHPCFSKLLRNLLPLAFDLLKQNIFKDISKAHIESRYD